MVYYSNLLLFCFSVLAIILAIIVLWLRRPHPHRGEQGPTGSFLFLSTTGPTGETGPFNTQIGITGATGSTGSTG